jgi:ABC-type branched-subunit amino acid transport system substrate-binding protein
MQATLVAVGASVLGAVCFVLPTPSAGAATLSSALTESSATSCAGTPIVIGQIASATGAFSFPDAPVAAKVAVAAVNKTCEDGRPLKLITCDDQSDPNAGVTCAHELVSDHVVAMVGNASGELSQAMSVTQAAGIPSVFNAGLTVWEVSNKLSYPENISLVQSAAVVNAAVGSGAKSIAFVAADLPLSSEVVGLLTSVAKPLGVKVIPLLYPPSTTDFSTLAAEAVAAKASAILVTAGASQSPPLFKALGQQGLASKTLLMTSAALFTPATISALGSAADNVYVIAPAALPVDATGTNAGITKMRKEYAADGQNSSNSNMTAQASIAWTGVHVFADAVKSTKTVTPASVQTALSSIGTVSQPQIPNWNASKNALPQLPVLAHFRVTSGGLFWYRVEGGKYTPVGSGAISASKPFSLTAKG